jgi:hypothetical protein
MSDEPRPSKLDGKRWGWGLTALGLLMALVAVVGTEVSPYAVILFVVIVSASVFWIWMLVDCLTTPFAEGSDKVSWVIVITFLHIVGAVLYCLVVKIYGQPPPRKVEASEL